MASTGLYGPYELDDDTVATMGSKPGAYALGSVDQRGTFHVSYVGRADRDLKKRLGDHIGSYASFKAAVYETAEAAFDKECTLYHDFDPPSNTIHPASPAGSNRLCPVCYPRR